MSRLVEDPRIDPRIKRVFGDIVTRPTPDVASREVLVDAMARAAAAGIVTPLTQVLASMDHEGIAPSEGLAIRTEQIVSAPDGNTINLLILTPEAEAPRACVYYIHGGGMATLSCYDPNYQAWGRLIARAGVQVVMVDFRNALAPSSAPEVAPYPAGLNDCVSGLRWVRANAAALGIDAKRILVAGESGGANLAIATLLSLKRAGELDGIAGLYVLCPYLAGGWPGGAGSSAEENAGILMDLRSNFGAMSYGIEAYEARDPLAWPGFASEADVTGFPRTVIAVNECDPLRDDGVDLYRKLLRADVSARCRQVMGTIHGTEVFLCCPDISREAARDIAAFAAA